MQPSTQATSILIVDDEISLRNTFRIFLQRAGYQHVVAVASFGEAIEAVSSTTFDLIICDIVLESHSGIDLLKRFRQLGISCPVVIITGYPHVETASEAVRLGAFDYLSKPVEKETLLKTARLAIQHYRLEQEKRAAEFAREGYRRFLETIFRSVSDSIISVDKDCNILQMNQAAIQLFQTLQLEYNQNGENASLCGNKDLRQLADHTALVLKTGTEVIDHRLEFFPGGACTVLSICISPLDDGTGTPAGAVLVCRDMSPKGPLHCQHRTRFHRMIGASPAMQSIFLLIENIGRVDTSVLLTGESGTGKELAVHALHQESTRRNHPLIMVDCASIPENLLESELFGHKKGAFTGAEETRMGRIMLADQGTLFLDEIGDISMAMQLRLLRFLQEKTFYPVGSDKEVHVDVRVIAATNVDLKEKVKAGNFREDLYYRLLIFDIHLPPLRDREGDVEILANHFLKRFADKTNKAISGISDQAMTMLCRYPWPGNVRQLEHVMERACILCTSVTISSEHLPAELQSVVEDSPAATISPGNRMSEYHRHNLGQRALTDQEQQATEMILTALKKAGGNKAKAARLLHIDRSTLYRKMHELHMDMDMFS